jgi:LPXTG-site transpeptidase (sortase) family protein
MNESYVARILKNKIAFLATFFLVFLVSYIVLVAIDFVPEPKTSTQEPANVVLATSTAATTSDVFSASKYITGTSDTAVLPVSLYIKKLDRTISVLNPTSRAIADLDTALLSGVVRHPDSATLSQNGNIFILGHSSYLPTVLNKNFQAFNGIQDLAWGDEIEVTANDVVYIYQVEKVYKAKAQDVTVPIATDEHRLTLATCNSFGTVDDRYIVEAKVIDARPL